MDGNNIVYDCAIAVHLYMQKFLTYTTSAWQETLSSALLQRCDAFLCTINNGTSGIIYIDNVCARLVIFE